MNNKPYRRYRRKKDSKCKQQILRKEIQKQAKYPIQAEYRQKVFLKQNRRRGA